jgi:hypothetical protein
MPLSSTGKKVLAAMEDEYGTKKGEEVFYASENKGKPGSEKWTVKNHLKKKVAKGKGQAKSKLT